jgi:hypothetical protein
LLFLFQTIPLDALIVQKINSGEFKMMPIDIQTEKIGDFVYQIPEVDLEYLTSSVQQIILFSASSHLSML